METIDATKREEYRYLATPKQPPTHTKQSSFKLDAGPLQSTNNLNNHQQTTTHQ